MQCFVSLTAGGLNPWLTVCSYANRDNDILILTFNHYEVNLRSSGVNFGHNYCMNAFISWHWLVISKPTPRYHLNALHTFVEAFRSDLRLASDQPLRARGSKSGHGQRVECLSSGLSGAVEGKIFFERFHQSFEITFDMFYKPSSRCAVKTKFHQLYEAECWVLFLKIFYDIFLYY